MYGKKKWALSGSADSISAASPAYQAHVPMELPSPSEKTTNPYKVYNQQIPSSPARMLENDRILIYLRSRPHKEQPPGLELGTQDWQSTNRTAEPHRRPPVYSYYGIYIKRLSIKKSPVSRSNL